MKKAIKIILAVIVVAALGVFAWLHFQPKPTSSSLAGVYYYEQTGNIAMDDSSKGNNKRIVHKLTISDPNQFGTKYKVKETGNAGSTSGTMTVDKKTISIKMNGSSRQLDKKTDSHLNTYGQNLKNLENLAYSFDKGVLTLDKQVPMYRKDTTKGDKLEQVYGGKSWQDVFDAKGNDTKKKQSKPQPAVKANDKKGVSAFDLNKISKGDFSEAAQGTWTQVGTAGNGLGGQPGFSWSTDPSQLTSKLTVSKDQVSDGTVTLAGNNLVADGKNSPVNYKEKNGAMVAGLQDESVLMNYSVTFYPKGTPLDSNISNGAPDNPQKNRIVFWTSNNGFTELFEQN